MKSDRIERVELVFLRLFHERMPQSQVVLILLEVAVHTPITGGVTPGGGDDVRFGAQDETLDGHKFVQVYVEHLIGGVVNTDRKRFVCHTGDDFPFCPRGGVDNVIHF